MRNNCTYFASWIDSLNCPKYAHKHHASFDKVLGPGGWFLLHWISPISKTCFGKVFLKRARPSSFHLTWDRSPCHNLKFDFPCPFIISVHSWFNGRLFNSTVVSLSSSFLFYRIRQLFSQLFSIRECLKQICSQTKCFLNSCFCCELLFASDEG